MSLHYLVKHEWPKNQHFVGFSVIHVSQGSVATYVRCGGMSPQFCTANFLLSLSVKEFLKSVKIWQSYCHPKFWGLGIFGTRCACTGWCALFALTASWSLKHFILPACWPLQRSIHKKKLTILYSWEAAKILNVWNYDRVEYWRADRRQ